MTDTPDKMQKELNIFSYLLKVQKEISDRYAPKGYFVDSFDIEYSPSKLKVEYDLWDCADCSIILTFLSFDRNNTPRWVRTLLIVEKINARGVVFERKFDISVENEGVMNLVFDLLDIEFRF